MNEPLTTYTVQGKNTTIVWQFKYRLNGLLYEFKLLQGELDNKQIRWLFMLGKFPYKEDQIKNWIKTIKNFKIEVGEPDLSFEGFLKAYGDRIKKKRAGELWKKLKPEDCIKAIKGIRKYDNWLKLQSTGYGRKHPDTYLYQRTWEDFE